MIKSTTANLWCSGRFTNINVYEVQEARVGVQVFRRELHIHIHLDQIRVKILSWKFKKRKKEKKKRLRVEYHETKEVFWRSLNFLHGLNEIWVEVITFNKKLKAEAVHCQNESSILIISLMKVSDGNGKNKIWITYSFLRVYLYQFIGIKNMFNKSTLVFFLSQIKKKKLYISLINDFLTSQVHLQLCNITIECLYLKKNYIFYKYKCYVSVHHFLHKR